MSDNVQQLFTNALQLNYHDRAELAGLLIGSLEHEHDTDSQAAWGAEITRRLAELQSGAVKPVPWPEVRRRLAKNAG